MVPLLTSAQGTYGINAFARYPGGHPISCVDGKLKM